jgi:pyruvate dehydrogenase E1 component alpha subunit
MNMAAVWKLPIVWVCENNSYSGLGPASMSTAVSDIADIAGSYGMPGVSTDGNDVLAVFDVTQHAVARARAGEGPSLVELKTYRVQPFAEGVVDSRDPQEVDHWKRRDPIEGFRRRLLERGILREDLTARIQEEAEREMQAAQAFAEESPFPEPEEAFEDLYA